MFQNSFELAAASAAASLVILCGTWLVNRFYLQCVPLSLGHRLINLGGRTVAALVTVFACVFHLIYWRVDDVSMVAQRWQLIGISFQFLVMFGYHFHVIPLLRRERIKKRRRVHVPADVLAFHI